MVNHSKWHILQLFAEGASGASSGEGSAAPATSGVESADAGHQRLRELGVPENRIRKNRAYQVKNQPAAEAKSAPAQEEQPEQQAAAAETTEPKTEAPPRMSWDDIVKDPEYNAEMQKIIQARVKEGNAAKAAMATISPWLKQLAKENGLDPENIDYDALVKSVNGEYENKALEMGTSKETVRQLDQQQRTIEQQKFQDHIQKLEQQGQAFKAIVPNFDLKTAMQDPVFARLTAPGVGLSVEQAFHALHYKEMQSQSMQVAAHKTAEQISNAIQSGSRRPDESGASAQAPSVTTFDYKSMSHAEREAFKKQIRQAAARGEKIYPGR